MTGTEAGHVVDQRNQIDCSVELVKHAEASPFARQEAGHAEV